MYNVKKQLEEEQERLKKCSSKEDLNELWKGRKICINTGEWKNEICDFIEMVGEGERQNWRMKVKTRFGTFLEFKASEVIILTQRIIVKESEVDNVISEIKKEFK